MGKCDNKVNTSFVVTFSLPTGEKNVTSQNAEVADAKGNFSDTSNNIITYPDDPA